MAVTSRPTLKKTSINLGNIGGRGGSGASRPVNRFADVGATAINNIKMIDSIIAVEDDVDELSVRVRNVEVTNDALVVQNRSFRESLDTIRTNIDHLQAGQIAIIENAKEKEKILERQRELEKSRLKKEEAEADLEGQLDEKKEGGKIKPLQKIGKNAMGVLGGLGNFLKFVVAGWFTDKTFKLIEAFQSDNKEKIDQIGKKLLAGTAIVGGLFLLSIGALGPVLGGIVGLIGTIGALLLNPVTLAALLIALGVGGAIVGIKKLFDWGGNKAAGGKTYKDAHKANWKKLEEAGITQSVGGGMFNRWNVKRDGQLVARQYKNLTDEEKAAVDAFKAEKQRIDDLKNAMNKELDNVWKTVPKTGTNTVREFGIIGHETTFKVHSEEDKKIIEQKKAAIREKYEKLLQEGKSLPTNAGNGNNVSSVVSNNNNATNFSKVTSNEGNISILPIPVETNDNNVKKGLGQGVNHLASANSSNMYVLDAQLQFNSFLL